MKESEMLKQQAATEDNDFRAFSLYMKADREERQEVFEEHIYPVLQKYFSVELYIESGRYRIIDKLYGQLDIYPKANKIYSFSRKKWFRNADWFIRVKLLGLDKD